MTDHPAMIRFRTVDPPRPGKEVLAINVLAGEGSATVTNGYGGWEVIERPGREAITHWVGFETLQITVPIMFDTMDSDSATPGVDLERQIADLEAMAGRGRARWAGEPPALYVNAPGSLMPHPSDTPTEYVIESIDWGDAIRNKHGNRIRQSAEVTLLKHVVAKGLERSAAKRRSSGKKGQPRTYVVKRGDTLSKLAKRFYGDPDKWKQIYQANKQKVRDPKKLQIGTKLRIPALQKK